MDKQDGVNEDEDEHDWLDDEPEEVDSQQTNDDPRNIPRGFSPWSESDDSSSIPPSDEASLTEIGSPLVEAQIEVEQIINHLARIAIAIRKAGTSSRLHKADRTFNPGNHGKLRKHLELVVLARGCEDGRSSYDIDSATLTPVQERLILANLRRRHRYSYAQKHAKKLAADTTSSSERDCVPVTPKILVTTHKEPDTRSSANTRTTKTKPPQVLNDDEDNMPTQHTVLTATSASGIAQTIDSVPERTLTPSMVAKTNITTTAAKILYPKPPRMKVLRYFRCPCCSQTLPELYGANTLWNEPPPRKHLMADVCPYICILDDCPRPERLYVTRLEWARHIEKEHGQCWQCPACSGPGRPVVIFPSIEVFREHLRHDHGGDINDEQHSTIVKDSARPAPRGIRRCPLCDFPDGVECPEYFVADSAGLLDHIAEHLHGFALRSLPWPRDGSEEGHEAGDPDDPQIDDEDYFDQGSDNDSQQDMTNDSDRDFDGLSSLSSESDDGSVETETPIDRVINSIQSDSDTAQKDISNATDDINYVQLDKHTIGNDINAYVTSWLEGSRLNWKYSQAQLHHIRERVIARADGIFLMATHGMKDVLQCHDYEIIEDSFTVPQDLIDIYRTGLETHSSPMERDRLFQFLVHAQQPLILDEAIDILATGTSHFREKDRIRDPDHLPWLYSPFLSTSLVSTPNGNSKQVHFINITAKEYLLSKPEFELKLASFSITRTCLVYLKSVKGSLEEVLRDFPLARRAMTMLMVHARFTENSNIFFEELYTLFQDGTRFDMWCRVFPNSGSQKRHTSNVWHQLFPNAMRNNVSPLYYTCKAGLFRLSRRLLEDGMDANAWSEPHLSAIYAASQEGFNDIIELLLVFGADAYEEYDPPCSPLQIAAENGHVHTVKLLLDRGQRKIEQELRDHALASASSRGHVEIVGLLLGHGADVNVRIGSGGNAFCEASRNGHVGVVEYLLDRKRRDPTLEPQGRSWDDAIWAASVGGHDKVVQLLRDERLCLAASGGDYDMVEALLNEGANPNTSGRGQRNALQSAVDKEYAGIVKALLEKGADPDGRGRHYTSALESAVNKENLELVEMLLEKGAKVYTYMMEFYERQSWYQGQEILLLLREHV
ncbi:hypothetical protein CGLO_12883 [Colletotrichum gloeosporioides Cg-14]|uniref:C2H2-type domain-containing protein n=1 Tax=Colletotrichum gloeosporioides (strain Cg-14) TaxID=1237896 RepID=T0K7K2_COLGC|nr:hypothetical protein CGLO_12883 [Colletotrichum gloeosporioides Cg-14]